MCFEWDDEKRRSNLGKHGVDFIDAVRIFAHPVLEQLDDREDYGEERLIAIGVFETSHFVVVYTWRRSNRRIISAWKAGKYEQEEYYNAIYG